MENVLNMRKIIKYFTYKYSGNWEEIYNAIKKKETIHPLNLVECEQKDNSQLGYISIIDENYPENYKQVYMPPMSIFYFGDQNILNNKHIISLWGDYKLDDIIEFNCNEKQSVYALRFNLSDFSLYEKLSNKDMKLILIDENKPDKIKLNYLKKINNFCYISEYPLDIECESKSNEQSFDRLLIGISRYSIFFNSNSDKFNAFDKIHKFESRNQYFFKSDVSIIGEKNKDKLISNIKNILILNN